MDVKTFDLVPHNTYKHGEDIIKVWHLLSFKVVLRDRLVLFAKVKYVWSIKEYGITLHKGYASTEKEAMEHVCTLMDFYIKD